MATDLLEVTFTKTSDGKPLATVHNLPGLDADLTPQQIRALAQALVQAANDCEAHSSHPSRFYSATFYYPLKKTPK